VEQNLTQNLSENFESYNRAFESFTTMQQDLDKVKHSISTQKVLLMQHKQGQLQSLASLATLHALRSKKQKVKEKLKQLVVLKQTVPIVQKLIQNSGNFQVALDLIQNAQNVCKGLQLDIAQTIKEQLSSLQLECAKKLEFECLKVVQQWFD
jgi:hypothetical protein